MLNYTQRKCVAAVQRGPVRSQWSQTFVCPNQALAAWLKFYTKKRCASDALWKFSTAMIGCRHVLTVTNARSKQMPCFKYS